MVPRPRATEDSDDDILVLDEAPAHLRIVTNEHAPIVIDSDTDDDDPNDPFGLNDQMNPLFGLTNRCRSRTWERTREGTTGEGAAGPSRSRKRSRRDSMELYSRSPSPPRKHARTGNAAAGSSRHAAFVLSDSDEGPAGPTANPAKTSDPILPKADYLVPVVQEIIPDVDPVWATARLTELMGTLKERPTPGQDAIDQIINEALETGEYPRIGGMPRPPKDVPEYGDPNYHRTERAGAAYAQIAMGALENAFPTVPVN